jgi:hypothetical protein
MSHLGPVQLGKERWAYCTLLDLAAIAVSAGTSARQVNEEAQLIVNVQLWVCSDAEAHLMALAFLVLFAREGVERSAAQVLV